MRVADYIANFLKEKKIKDIFMLTGYGAMYLNDAIKLNNIKYYATRNEAMMIVADKNISLLISGTGDVIETDDGILGIGSGGPYAISAAKALIKNTNLDAEKVAIESLNIAADICVYTNHNIILEKIDI